MAYLGYYRYSNAAGNASKTITGRADSVQYAYTANLLWQALGQVPQNYSLDEGFDTFKANVMDEYQKWDKLPSFNGSNQTVNVGETKELIDDNGVFQYYESFEFEKDKVTFKHTKGTNKLIISVAENATKEKVEIIQNDAENYKMGKYINTRTVKTNLMLSPIPENQVTHQRLLVCYGYNDPKYMRIRININLNGNLELSKKDDKGNYVPNNSFLISNNSDMSNQIENYTTGSNGWVLVEGLKSGTVYVQETNVPKHLVLDTTIKSITIKTAQTTSFEATNRWKQGRIQVVKKDEETGKIIKKTGTVFDIYDNNNRKVTSITTKENGIATSELLDYGTYYIKESTAPNK